MELLGSLIGLGLHGSRPTVRMGQLVTAYRPAVVYVVLSVRLETGCCMPCAAYLLFVFEQ